MYRLLKENGSTATIYIENTEEHTILSIGTITMDILKILEDAGHITEEVSARSAWNFEISEETKDKLKVKAMRMKKPVRDQSKKKSEQDETHHQSASQDAFDLIFGI